MLEQVQAISPTITVTVHAETGRDLLAKNIVYRRLEFDTNDELEIETVVQFARAVVQTTKIEGGLGFDWPSATSSPEALQKGLEGFLNLPGSAVRMWLEAITRADMPPGDPDLFPPEDVEKKD